MRESKHSGTASRVWIQGVVIEPLEGRRMLAGDAGSVVSLVDNDPDDQIVEALRLAVGGSVVSQLDEGTDVDLYRIDAPAKSRIAFQLFRPTRPSGSSKQPSLRCSTLRETW